MNLQTPVEHHDRPRPHPYLALGSLIALLIPILALVAIFLPTREMYERTMTAAVVFVFASVMFGIVAALPRR